MANTSALLSPVAVTRTFASMCCTASQTRNSQSADDRHEARGRAGPSTDIDRAKRLYKTLGYSDTPAPGRAADGMPPHGREPRARSISSSSPESVARDPIRRHGTTWSACSVISAPRTPPSRVVKRRVGPIAVLDRLLDGEAIEGRERAARGGAPGGTGRGNDEH